MSAPLTWLDEGCQLGEGSRDTSWRSRECGHNTDDNITQKGKRGPKDPKEPQTESWDHLHAALKSKMCATMCWKLLRHVVGEESGEQ